MKTYFAKYLPVEGEIKGNGTLWIAKENLGKLPPMKLHLGISFTEKEAIERAITKVKLFLCSRDIQVGDEIKANVNGGEYHKVIDIIGDSIDCQSFNGISNETFYRKDCCKVIGEISPEATWVKERDEFEEKDIQRCIWTAPDSKTEEREMIPVQTEKWFNMKYKKDIGEWQPLPLENKVIMIKGPCGHFH